MWPTDCVGVCSHPLRVHPPDHRQPPQGWERERRAVGAPSVGLPHLEAGCPRASTAVPPPSWVNTDPSQGHRLVPGALGHPRCGNAKHGLAVLRSTWPEPRECDRPWMSLWVLESHGRVSTTENLQPGSQDLQRFLWTPLHLTQPAWNWLWKDGRYASKGPT